MDPLWTEVIEKHPIAKGLDGFRASFTSVRQAASKYQLCAVLGELEPDQLQNLIFTLLAALQVLPAARALRAKNGKSLFVEIPRLNATIATDDFDFDRLCPLQMYLATVRNELKDKSKHAYYERRLLYTDKSPSKRGGEWSTVPSTAMAISYDTLDLSKSICWSLGND